MCLKTLNIMQEWTVSRMTLDEAIKHCLKVAEQNENAAEDYGKAKEAKRFLEKQLAAEDENRCLKCAAEYRQFAEWLTELRELRSLKTDYVFFKAEAKKLLKAAVEGFKFLGAWMDEHEDCTLECSKCPLHRAGVNCRCWNKQDEALALIGEEGRNNA